MSAHNFSLEVITPVHVGMGREKDYIKGLDYIYQNGNYIIYSQQKMLNSLNEKEANAVSSFLSTGNFPGFANYVNSKHLIKKDMIVYEWPCDYETQSPNDEIKRCAQDGLGNWLIPGSSIKGSLRSVIATALYKSRGNINDIRLDDLLGKIDNNIMRFVQVSDCQVSSQPGIFPVKIFSADPKNSGQWKHQRQGGHSENFLRTNGNVDLGFVSFYEMLTDGVNSQPTSGSLRINWDAPEIIKEKRKQDIPNLNKVFTDQGIEWLIESARLHTNRFIEKEIHFFETYKNNSITAESLMNELKWLKEENDQIKNGFLLRVGANVGWHSITGDWKFNDFVSATESNRGNIVGRGMEKAFKTRKLIFDWQYAEDDATTVRRFALPGFVKITLQK